LADVLRALFAVIHLQAGEKGIESLMKSTGFAEKLFPFVFQRKEDDADEPGDERNNKIDPLQEQVAEMNKQIGKTKKVKSPSVRQPKVRRVRGHLSKKGRRPHAVSNIRMVSVTKAIST
jgi:hypothetical protein